MLVWDSQLTPYTVGIPARVRRVAVGFRDVWRWGSGVPQAARRGVARQAKSKPVMKMMTREEYETEQSKVTSAPPIAPTAPTAGC